MITLTPEQVALIRERQDLKNMTFFYRYSIVERSPLPYEAAALARLKEVDEELKKIRLGG